jgi:hypothetical protein
MGRPSGWPEKCGEIRTIGRTEWVCDKPVHDHEAPRLLPSRIDDPAERHRFVARYPWRDRA